MMKTMKMCIVSIGILACIAVVAEATTWDFEDGTRQGWTAMVYDGSVDYTAPVTISPSFNGSSYHLRHSQSSMEAGDIEHNYYSPTVSFVLPEQGVFLRFEVDASPEGSATHNWWDDARVKVYSSTDSTWYTAVAPFKAITTGTAGAYASPKTVTIRVSDFASDLAGDAISSIRIQVNKISGATAVGQRISLDNIVLEIDETAPISLDSDADDAMTPNIALDGNGHIAVFWSANHSNTYPEDMYNVYSTNGGVTFGTAGKFAQSDGSTWFANRQPNAVYDSGNLHLAWTVHSDTQSPNYSKSTDHGITWSSRVNVSTGNLPRDDGIGFAVNGQTLQTMNFDDDWHIYGGKSSDGGTNWTATDLSPSLGGAAPPRSYMSSAVFDSSGNFYAICEHNNGVAQEKVRILREVGGTLGSAYLTDLSSTIDLANEHSLAINGSNIFAVYSISNNVYLRSSSDMGVNWTTAVQVDDASTGDQVKPVIGISRSGRLYVAWQDGRSSVDQIYYATSSNNGSTWSASTLLSESTNDQIQPDIALDGQDSHFVWVEDGLPMYFAIIPPKGTLIIVQ